MFIDFCPCTSSFLRAVGSWSVVNVHYFFVIPAIMAIFVMCYKNKRRCMIYKIGQKYCIWGNLEFLKNSISGSPRINKISCGWLKELYLCLIQTFYLIKSKLCLVWGSLSFLPFFQNSVFASELQPRPQLLLFVDQDSKLIKLKACILERTALKI